MKTLEATTGAATATTTRCSKSATGNFSQNPMGAPDNIWNNSNFHHYNDEQDKRNHQDEELTSMLQKYLDHNCDQTSLDSFVYHQKSPGQMSTDSGFSGDQKLQVAFDLNDYEDNGEDLSQLVDQVLSSIDAQFPVDSYLAQQQPTDDNFPACNGHFENSDCSNKKAISEERKAVAVTRPMPQNCRYAQQHQSQQQMQQQQQQQQQQLPLQQRRPQTEILAPNNNSKKRTVGVVEPRVVVKIPWAKVRDTTKIEESTNEASSEDPTPREPEANQAVKSSTTANEDEPTSQPKRPRIEEKKPAEPEESSSATAEDVPTQPFVVYNYMDDLPSFSNPKRENPSKTDTADESTTTTNQQRSQKKPKARVSIETETDGQWMYCKEKNCSFWTRKQVRMERHEKSHVPGDDKFYQCPECRLKICSLSKLLRHDRKFHTGFKDYECKICEAEVTDIAVHMRVHRTEKQFTCHVCKLQFRHKNSLVRHLFQHSGERPFRCQNCESGFTSINRLKEHIKKRHPETPAAQSIMEPLMAAPIVATPSTSADANKAKHGLTKHYAPIAPAPAKIIAPAQFQPAPAANTFMFSQNIPILAQGPNGQMILVSHPTPTFAPSATPTFMFPTVPQFMFQPQPQPLIYGMPTTTILGPQVQTFANSVNPSFVATPTTTTATATPTTMTTNASSPDEITVLSENGEAQKYDILERAILEIPNFEEEGDNKAT